jgi:hypothetical protein
MPGSFPVVIAQSRRPAPTNESKSVSTTSVDAMLGYVLPATRCLMRYARSASPARAGRIEFSPTPAKYAPTA